MSSPVHYKLSYFDVRARGEPARLILAYSGVAWEEERVPRNEWAARKPSTPMGQLPVLEVDGKPLAQSMAIARYLAKVHGLAGENDWESAQCDMMVDGIYDQYQYGRAWFIEKDPEKKQKLWDDMVANRLPPVLEVYENFLKKNGTGFLVGKKVSWADLTVSEWVDFWERRTKDLLGKYPEIKKHKEKIRSLPNIAKWIQTRPYTEF